MTLETIYKSDRMPSSYAGRYDESSLNGYDLKPLFDLDAEAAFYWYGTGSYEGAGEMIILKGGRWFLCDLGHCSCYGPSDGIKIDGSFGYGSFDELERACTSELQRDVHPLIELIREKGYVPESYPDDINIGVL